MVPLVPLAAIGLGAYALKRWFDGKKVTSAPVTPTGFSDGGAAPPPAPADPGGGSSGGGGGGSAGPYDPGYPMSTDPTYAAPPMSLNQMGATLKQLTQPKIMTAQARAASPTAGSFAARAASIPSTYLASGPEPVPVAPPPKTFSAITAAVAPAPAPNVMVRGLGGKTFSR